MKTPNASSAVVAFISRVLQQTPGDTTKHTDMLGQVTLAFFHEGCTKANMEILKQKNDRETICAVNFGFMCYDVIEGSEKNPFSDSISMLVVLRGHRLHFDVTYVLQETGLVFTLKSKNSVSNHLKIHEREKPEDAVTILMALFDREIEFNNYFTSNGVPVPDAPAPVKAEEPAPVIGEFKGTIPPDTWLPGEHLAPLAQAIQRYIKETDSGGWLSQGRELGCQTKYLNIRVDQRTGHFVVSGDSVPTIHIDHNYPDHMYPRGWDSKCKMNPMILQLVIDTNQLVDRKVTNQQIRNQVGNVENWLQEMVGRRVLEISSKKAITGTELMKYYGKKS